MASSFKDDSYRRPNFAIDGATPEYFRRPRLPQWVDPRGLPTLPSPPPVPWVPSLPSPPKGRNPFTDPLAVPPPPQTPPPHDVDPPNNPNWLIAENLSGRAESARNVAPAESPGGLLGMLYEMMRQGGPKPDAGFDSNREEASEQAPPERRLGRRTYRA